MMKHAKKVLSLGTILSVLVLIAFPLFSVPVDAATVLESETSARASLGDSFSIEARGEAGIRTNDFESRVLTRMYLEFTIVRNGTRGVYFEITSGYMVLNYTRYTIMEGIGIAGRTDEGRFNNTIVFGFRLNMTNPEGIDASVGFRGFVARNGDRAPILMMRGQIMADDLILNLIQRGAIRRL